MYYNEAVIQVHRIGTGFGSDKNVFFIINRWTLACKEPIVGLKLLEAAIKVQGLVQCPRTRNMDDRIHLTTFLLDLGFDVIDIAIVMDLSRVLPMWTLS